jgi:hypothetical protein
MVLRDWPPQEYTKSLPEFIADLRIESRPHSRAVLRDKKNVLATDLE